MDRGNNRYLIAPAGTRRHAVRQKDKDMKRIGMVILAIVVLCAGLAFWKKEELGRLSGVLSLFSENKIVHNFSNMNNTFLSTGLTQNNVSPSPLPQGPQATLPPQVATWVKDRNVTSLVVLKDGNIVFEEYYHDTKPDDVRINWSISKSYLSALFGVVVAEGHIDSIDDPASKYAPELQNTAYRDASIKDVLQMSSGVTFDEDYLAFFSDINKMGRVLALGGSMDAFALQQNSSFAAPGETWRYVSIDTLSLIHI